MKKIVLLLGICLSFTGMIAQIATDFTAKSCAGNPYHLFSELDSSKVVVICWAMPCASCIVPLQTTFHTVESYQDSLPGMVNMLICDDLANTDCATINLWAKTYGMEQATKFSDSTIRMTDYGNQAMPKVVVTGGPGHQVFFVSDYTVDGKALEKAIDSAIAMITTLSEFQELSETLMVFPNPANRQTTVSWMQQKPNQVSLDVLDIEGCLVKKILSGFRSAGHQTESFSIESLRNGLYTIRLTYAGKSIFRKLLVVHE